jgi:hypothetical protein
VFRDEKLIIQLLAQRSSSHPPGEFDAPIHDLPAGDYQINVGTSQAPGASRLPIRVGVPLEAELADISPDEARLKRIAAGTGGEEMDLEDIDDLPHKLAEAGRREPGFSEYPLWDSPYLFAFIVGCLGAEWALRKRFGLA